ncbi:MAG TPA: ABC transporter permease [Chloroflexus aurantiacus]|jgi:NitT/TauT family transport system permease protein|uniref:Binding-protein-dependent transport systems inner membrane component n=1 Tax=Chloroflexus aurantiacus (strain ATCC 29366 / DSM 635 / J-10-fl) TaxID=324602 RepID=A9WBU8_CHLAA|nr:MULTISPECIES: ABC transporter permease subunit [Chloroflexus]ABY36900.1 binding-protein-dependent transport systems inner membrane component [Chloroflexus aurantiacus J-10-fl]RMG50589.1 MAG: ABC transporter permease subunit [Chloroflexota bacterium]HBW67248.1 ABC transporter permease [Chloroflexus aurantiacus]
MFKLRTFTPEPPTRAVFTQADLWLLLVLIGLIGLAGGVASSAPETIRGPEISLSLTALPFYALYSVGRMAMAYMLSFIFTLVYGYIAAYNPRAERILIPLLDVLQSVPILSFLPVVLLGLSAILPQAFAVELTAVVLIFTSQVWNMTFAWYQSLTTIPKELREASSIFRFSWWQRFITLEFPFGAPTLVWNSMMSWAGGWFFLMAAEIFTLGERDFRLPGLGAFLQTAADTGDLGAIGWGLFSLAVVIVVLDQLVWRPLLVWSRRFRLEFVEREEDSTSWFYDLWQRSMLVAWIGRRLRWLNDLLGRWLGQHPADDVPTGERRRSLFGWIALAVIIVLTGWGLLNGSRFLFSVSLTQWGEILLGVAATFGRVSVAMCIALLWTVPLGVLIGTRQKIAAVLQPVVQILASIPATALFPVLVLALLEFPGGLNLAAIALMMLGTQWYILFNVIAGVNAIPQDLRFTSDLLQLHGWRRWRTLILPGLFPYLITGLITASGGAWNASIVAEYVVFNQQTYQTIGIGSTIAAATDAGDFAKLFAATLTMIITVVTINRLVWRRLYRLAEDRYRLE